MFSRSGGKHFYTRDSGGRDEERATGGEHTFDRHIGSPEILCHLTHWFESDWLEPDGQTSCQRFCVYKRNGIHRRHLKPDHTKLRVNEYMNEKKFVLCAGGKLFTIAIVTCSHSTWLRMTQFEVLKFNSIILLIFVCVVQPLLCVGVCVGRYDERHEAQLYAKCMVARA